MFPYQVIGVDEIVFESSEAHNITGHFSDLFVGWYRVRSKVALKRPRIARNDDSQRSIQVRPDDRRFR